MHNFIFTVIEAENGKQGLDKVLENKPELIISDLMMPVMDGLQFLQEVRKNKIMHDIPFIMLTARADDEDRLSGYKAKADEYMTKPFNSEELILRVSNLLQTRKHLEEKFSKKVIAIDFEDQEMISADKDFLNRLKKIVIENIANSDFGMQDFAEKAFLSERQLRRKITELTSLSPIEFIRQIRLQKAKELLENKVYYSIAEVSAAVGFKNPHYFSRMYKNMQGISPHHQLGKKVF
jgi:YesN/AraC family two-component response regulator